MSNSSNDRRDRAAAAKAAANAGGKRRERIIRIAGAATVAIIVIAIIVISMIAKSADSGSTNADPSVTASANPNAALPKTVFPSSSAYAFGVPFSTAKSTAPVLQIWEDFQCPACQALEKANGAGIQELASSGSIQLTWRPTTFLDKNLNNDASLRATAAWGCAIDQGKAVEYHNTLYANPPANEGDGFTNIALVDFADQSGIQGAARDKFTKCMNAETYTGWAANSTAAFYASGAQGTPYALLNGTVVPNDVLANKDKLAALVASATKS